MTDDRFIGTEMVEMIAKLGREGREAFDDLSLAFANARVGDDNEMPVDIQEGMGFLWDALEHELDAD